MLNFVQSAGWRPQAAPLPRLPRISREARGKIASGSCARVQGLLFQQRQFGVQFGSVREFDPDQVKPGGARHSLFIAQIPAVTEIAG